MITFVRLQLPTVPINLITEYQLLNDILIILV